MDITANHDPTRPYNAFRHDVVSDRLATLTILKQIKATPDTGDQQALTVSGRIYGDEHTLYDGIRLKLGYLF